MAGEGSSGFIEEAWGFILFIFSREAPDPEEAVVTTADDAVAVGTESGVASGRRFKGEVIRRRSKMICIGGSPSDAGAGGKSRVVVEEDGHGVRIKGIVDEVRGAICFDQNDFAIR